MGEENEILYGLVVRRWLMIWILKRFFRLLLILATVTFLCFFIEAVLPGDPAEAVLSGLSDAPASEKLIEMRKHLKIELFQFDRALNWLKGVLALDFGVSYRSGELVWDEIIKHLPVTLILTFLTLIWVVPISFVGAWIAVKNKKTGLFFKTIGYIGIIIPVYLLGTILALLAEVFCFDFSYRGLTSVAFASVVLGLPLCGFYIQVNQGFMIDVLFSDYVKFAYAKGLSEWKVFFYHVLPALFPQVLVLWCMSFGRLLGGSVIVEELFGLPGVGRLFVEAVSSRDYPVIQALIFLSGCVIGVLMEFADIALPLLNPRIKSGNVGAWFL